MICKDIRLYKYRHSRGPVAQSHKPLRALYMYVD